MKPIQKYKYKIATKTTDSSQLIQALTKDQRFDIC